MKRNYNESLFDDDSSYEDEELDDGLKTTVETDDTDTEEKQSFESEEDASEITLSKLASYLYAFGNDVRLLHLYTSGVNFLPYHEKLNDLYDIVFDAYDKVAEMAISHDEDITNPSDIIEEWSPIEGNNFNEGDILKIIEERGNDILAKIANVKEYESFVHSNIDEFYGDIDEIINYIFKQSSK